MTGFSDLGWARPDTDREARLGLPEVVYGPGKQPAQIAGVVTDLLAANTGPVLVTRVEPDAAAAVLAAVPGGTHEPQARLLHWRAAVPGTFTVAVVAAGTSDGPVAAEAAAIAAAIGLAVDEIHDVGVAGIHRLLAVRDRIAAADAVICIAGMEGALPSIVGGLTATPVVAVPTSVGYGSSFEGLSALLGMLNSCAAGIVVCNIDNGFGAAMFALRVVNGRPGATPRTDGRR